jgi:hypothetical protein
MSSRSAVICLTAISSASSVSASPGPSSTSPSPQTSTILPKSLKTKQRIAKKLGYPKPLKTVSGFNLNTRFREHAKSLGIVERLHPAGPDQSLGLLDSRKPQPLFTSTFESISFTTPAFDDLACVACSLDPEGNLICFEAVPAHRIEPANGHPTSYDLLLDASGINRSS